MGIFQDERQDIESHLSNNFTTVPIKWDNVDFDQDVEEFIACFIAPGRAVPTSLGNTQLSYERRGQLILSIFTPKGEGTDRNRELADELLTIFNKLQLDEITFDEFEYINAGEIEERYRGNLLLYYRWKKCM